MHPTATYLHGRWSGRRLLKIAGRMLRLMRYGGFRSWHDTDVLWIRLKYVQRLSGHLLLLLKLMLMLGRRRVAGDDDGRAGRGGGEQVGGHVLRRGRRADWSPSRRVDSGRQRW